MSKFMKKYDVKISGKLNEHSITMVVPVNISLMQAATNEALELASHSGVSDVEILSITERPEEYEQLPLDFGEDEDSRSEEDDCCEPSGYTPYSPSVEPKAGYTPYSQAKRAEDPLPPTFTPRVNNSYTPYKTRVVSIDSKYAKHKFK